MSGTGALPPDVETTARTLLRSALADMVRWPTESQNPERASVLTEFQQTVVLPWFERMGFACDLLENPAGGPPFLLAERMEDPTRPTVLAYGHGDTILGQDTRWTAGLNPWEMTERDGLWYGRGTADNKGQLAINLTALETVLSMQGELGFNLRYLVEMGEETGSPGLRDLCRAHPERLKADCFIASDGPRISAGQPTIFLGSRSAATFDLHVRARDRAYHSGNFGGTLSDPAIQLAHAIASITTATGALRIPAWRPTPPDAAMRDLLAPVDVTADETAPKMDPDWGEPGLSLAEQLYAWCSFDVLAMTAGTPAAPVNAVPAEASARCQLRYISDIDPDAIVPALRAHLDAQGFPMVEITPNKERFVRATRAPIDSPWVRFVTGSIQRATGKPVRCLPNFGGSLPNDAFAGILGLPTIWIPHSYPACNQHAPDEHIPRDLAYEGLRAMIALFRDLGEVGFNNGVPDVKETTDDL